MGEGFRPWGTLESSSLMFDKSVPVKIKSASGDKEVRLNIRVVVGLSKYKWSSKVLQIHITDDTDPFFFYSMETNEDDFQALKVEQSLLVDFFTFPHMFIELLEYCIVAGANNTPRFMAIFNVRTTDATLSIVELNQFKQLSHLSLCFSQGNDSTMKDYLASRLAEYKNASSDSHEKLCKSSEALETALADITRLKRELADIKESQAYTISELKSQHLQEMANEKEKAFQETNALKQKLEQERLRLERWMGEHSDHQRDATSMDREIRLLTDTKHMLEMQVVELKTRLEVTTKDLEESQRECEAVCAKNESLAEENKEASKMLHQHLIQINTLEQEVQDKSEMIRNYSKQLEYHISLRDGFEESLKEAQSTAWRAEEKAAANAEEMYKCNHLIERLQEELQLQQTKMKAKTELLSQQDTLLLTHQAIVDNGSVESIAMQQEIMLLKADNDALKRKEEDLERKLQESQELLKSNEQMIQWLNDQLFGKSEPSGVSRCNLGAPHPSSLDRSSGSSNCGSTITTKAPSPGSHTKSSSHARTPFSSNGILTTSSAFNARLDASAKENHSNYPYSHCSTGAEKMHCKSSYSSKVYPSSTDQANQSSISHGLLASKIEECIRNDFTLDLRRTSLPRPQLSFADPRPYLAASTRSTFGKKRLGEPTLTSHLCQVP